MSDDEGNSRSGSGREGSSRWPAVRMALLVLGCALVAGATAVALLTDDARWLKASVLAAGWACALALIAGARPRSESEWSHERVKEMRRGYELEVEREVAARREYELQLEVRMRRELDAEMAVKVAALRSEIGTLRQDLAGSETAMSVRRIELHETRLDGQDRSVIERKSVSVEGASSSTGSFRRPELPPIDAADTVVGMAPLQVPSSAPSLPTSSLPSESLSGSLPEPRSAALPAPQVRSLPAPPGPHSVAGAQHLPGPPASRPAFREPRRRQSRDLLAQHGGASEGTTSARAGSSVAGSSAPEAPRAAPDRAFPDQPFPDRSEPAGRRSLEPFAFGELPAQSAPQQAPQPAPPPVPEPEAERPGADQLPLFGNRDPLSGPYDPAGSYRPEPEPERPSGRHATPVEPSGGFYQPGGRRRRRYREDDEENEVLNRVMRETR